MAASTIVPVRVPPETKEAWEAAARRDGSSLSAWVRDTLNEAAKVSPTGKPSAPPRDPSNRGGKKARAAAGRARTGRCPHGRAADEFCSRCDT